jgi:precorrin-2 dehydrogenase/sirohydrochlorin ferrochelatase
MPVKYYPVCLDISNRKCVVVGGGDVAERKVLHLLECGAVVDVVGMELTAALKKMADSGRIGWIEAPYEDRFLEGSFLAIGATDRPEVNRRVYEDARQRGVLVNVVDVPACCDFIVPSVVRRGDLTVAVSTGGRSPALAKKIREDLEARYGPEYADFLRIMGRIREKVIGSGQGSEANRRVFEEILRSPLLECIREGRWEDARKLVREYAGEDVPLD